MPENSSILVIRDSSGAGDAILRSLEPLRPSFRLQSVDGLPIALARISGGGVAAVVIDARGSKSAEADKLETFLSLREVADDLPVVVVYDSEHEDPLVTMIHATGSQCVSSERCGEDLALAVRSGMEKKTATRRVVEMPETRSPRHTIGFIGVKGGAGTTTVAINVASVLSQYSRVILAELTPAPGALTHYLHVQPAATLADVFRRKPGDIDGPALESCLWPYNSTPGWFVLFAPPLLDPCAEFQPAHIKAFFAAAAGLADYTLVDLPVGLSDASRAAIQECAVVAIVVERDPICLAAAREFLKALQFWQVNPARLGSVIVNRAVFSSPLDLPGMELQLGIPTLGVIPPAADLCLAAYNAKCPIVSFDPGSLAAQSLSTLAQKLGARAWTQSHREIVH